MNRRESFTAFGASVAGVLGLTAAAKGDTTLHATTKGFVVVTQEVGNLPPFKAEAFVERIKDRMVKARESNGLDSRWQIIVQPTREYGAGKVEVFVVDKDADIKPVEKLIFDTKQDRLFPHNRVAEYAEEELQLIRDYVHLMMGAPVIETSCIDRLITHFIERGTEVQRQQPPAVCL